MKNCYRLAWGFWLFLALAVFSCSSKKPSTGEASADSLRLAQLMQPVADAGQPAAVYQTDSIQTAGSLEIVSFGPVGETKGQAQILIEFATPLIPMTTLSDAVREERLRYFVLTPPVRGAFRFLGATTVVFQPEHSLPMATQFEVTVRRGLTDLAGNSLDEDFSFRFRTPLPRIEILPQNNSTQVPVDIPVRIISSVALNLESLRQHVRFLESLSQTPVAFDLTESEENPPPEADIGMRRVFYTYFLQPKTLLKKNTSYTVELSAGIMTARGNLPTEKAIVSTFRTFPPFRFAGSGFCPECGANLVTVPYLSFTTEPDLKTAQQFISLEPQTESFPFTQYSCVDNSIRLLDNLLQPKTTYRIILKPGLRDKFGQTLENPDTVTITTGDRTPQMWAARGLQIVTPEIPPALVVKAINISAAFYRLFSVSPQDVLVRENLSSEYFIEKWISRLRADEQLIRIPLDTSGAGELSFDLKPSLGEANRGVVAYSFRSPRIPCYNRPLNFHGLLLRTDMGIFSQFYPSGGVIKLNRLTDGEPIAGARVRMYRNDRLPRIEEIPEHQPGLSGKEISPCFQGVTDEQGMLYLTAEQLSLCAPSENPSDVFGELSGGKPSLPQPPQVTIIAEKDSDWTFLQTTYSGTPAIWRFGVFADWEGGKPLSRGTIFSDQFLYRPGDTVQMKGLSRYLLNGKLRAGSGEQVIVKVRDPMGSEVNLDTVRVSDFGTFHFSVPTRKGQPLGYYQVTAETPNPRLRFYGTFRLAEYRVPEFKVELEIQKKVALVDESIPVSWKGIYYFGAPMAEAPSSLVVTRRRTTFRPPGWPDFAFGIPSYLEEQKISLSGLYLKESIRLNKNGEASKALKLSASDVPFPMTYNCDVEVQDVSRQTVSANRSFTALPDRRLIGIQISSPIVARQNPVSAKVIVVSPDGKPMPGVPLRVRLLKREYHSIKIQMPDGRFRMEHNLETREIAQSEVVSDSVPVPVQMVPPEAGAYTILAELKTRPKSGTQAAQAIWVSGKEYVPWEEKGEDRLEIVLDKSEYQVGQEAVAFIKSPFPEAELFFTVSREKMFLQDVRRITGSAYSYRFRVTEEMLPNAYVGALLIRRGQPLVPIENEAGKHLERIGFAPFNVSLNKKYLSVNIRPERTTARPGDSLRVDVQVSDPNGTGVSCELTVMVVDEGVLALTGYRPPDLVKLVYQSRGLSARINDNRPFVVSQEALLQKGSGYGGGLMEGLALPRVRKRFLKLAYYNPQLITRGDGRATFYFKLPDNLTTWRITAVAVSKEDLFGTGDTDAVVTQPFLLRPVLPRFVRVDDRFRGGVAITNLTASKGSATVKLELADSQLKAGESGSLTKTISIEPGQSRRVLFPLQAISVGEPVVEFSAQFNGMFQGKAVSEADALRMSLPIQGLPDTEAVVEAGETTNKVVRSVKKDAAVRNDLGGLNILLSSTALTNVAAGAQYLANYPYGCLEQTASRLLGLIQLNFLSQKYGFVLESDKPLESVINADLQSILSLQNRDGGFKFWPDAQGSDCFVSPYVAYLFYRAQQLGYSIPDAARRNLIAYLDGILRNPCYRFTSWKLLAEYRLQVLLGLQYLGRTDQTYFEEYYHRRNELSYDAQIALTYLLYQSPQWKNEARILLDEIKKGVFVSARSAHLESPRELPPSYRFMESPVITTARGLKLFLNMEPENEWVARFARYILNARKNGRWRNTYENATAIDALVELSLQKEAHPPNFAADIRLAGKALWQEVFRGYDYAPRRHFVETSRIPFGSNALEIAKSGEGTLYYLLSYVYRLKGLQPARQEGMAITRTVRNRISGRPVAQFAVQPPEAAEVHAGDVLEVELEYLVPQSAYHVLIDDPIPAGLEAIDVSLKTTSHRYRQSGTVQSYQEPGYQANPITHAELRDDRVILYAAYCPPGIYKYRYLLRATGEGVFFWPGATVSLMYEPEQFGRCAEGALRVEE